MAKRVNKRFLIVLSLVVVGGGLGALLTAWYINRPNAAKLIKEGDDHVAKARNFMQAAAKRSSTAPSSTRPSAADADDQIAERQEWERARDAYLRALRVRKSAELYVKTGDVFHQLVRFYPREGEASNDIKAWQQALETRPGYIPALQRLLDEWIVLAPVRRSASDFDELARKAKALADADPADRRAKAWQHIAAIQSWLISPGSPKTLEDAIYKEPDPPTQRRPTGLETLLSEAPSGAVHAGEDGYRPEPLDESLILSNIVIACLQRAAERESMRDDEAARQWRVRALVDFETALKAQPDNPGIWLGYYTLQSQLRDVMLQRLGATLIAPFWREFLLGQSLRAAVAKVRPDDPAYTGVMITASMAARRRGDAEAGAALLKQLEKGRPDDMAVRFALVEQYRNIGDLDTSLELLNRPVLQDPTLAGIRSLFQRDNDLRRHLLLADVLLDRYETSRLSAPQRAELNRQIRGELEQVTRTYPQAIDRSPFQSLRARVLLTLDGDRKSRLEAIALMRTAFDALEAKGAVDPRMTERLITALEMERQSGEARKYLAKLAAKSARPDLLLRLARAYLVEGQTDQASRILVPVGGFLSSQARSDDPAVMALREQLTNLQLAAMSTASRPKPEIVGFIKRNMPEQTRAQKLRKAQLLLAQDADEARALLEPLADEELRARTTQPSTRPAQPNELLACPLLIRAYLNGPEPKTSREKSHALAARIAAAYPGDFSWKITELQLRETPDSKEIDRLTLQEIGRLTDPLQKRLEEYNYYLGKDAKQAADALADVEKLSEQRLRDLEAQKTESGRIDQVKDMVRTVMEERWKEAAARGEWDRAEKYSQRLVELDPYDSGALFQKVRTELARKQYQAALDDAGALVARAGDLPRSWLAMASAQQNLGQYDQAVRSFSQVLDRDLLNAGALQGIVECYLSLGNRPEATRYIDRALRTVPQNQWFQSAAIVLKEQDDPETATAERELDWQRNPDAAWAFNALYQNYLGILHRATARKDEAKRAQCLKKAKDLLAAGMAKWPDSLSSYANRANLAAWEGKLDEALDAIRQLEAREKWKDSPEPHLLLASVQQMRGAEHVADAEAELKTAVSAAEKLADQKAITRSKQRLAEFYLTTKGLDKGVERATAIYAELFEKTHDFAIGELLTKVYTRQGKLDEAVAVARKALERSPENAAAKCLLATTYLVTGKPEEGLKLLEEVIKAQPNYWPALMYRGSYRLSRGEINTGLADLEQARQNAGAVIGVLWERLAEAYLNTGRRDDAVDIYEELLKADAQSIVARSSLIQLHMAEGRWVAVETLLRQAKDDPELSRSAAWWMLEAAMWDARRDPQRRFDSISVAYRMSPKDPGIESIYIDSLLETGQYAEVLKLTEPPATAEALPWWKYTMRAGALAKTGKVAEGEAMLDKGMTAVDAATRDPAGQDAAAQGLVKGASACFDLAKLEKHFTDRNASRWTYELAAVYNDRAISQNTPADWEKACELADRLLKLREEPNKYTAFQEMRALNRAAQIYSGAVLGLSDRAARDNAAAKAQQVYESILTKLRQKGDVMSLLYALNNLACFLADRPGQQAKALEYATEAYQLMQKADVFLPALADTYGDRLTAAGRVDEAIGVLEKVIKTRQAPPEAFLHLGEALLKKARFDDVEKIVNQMLELWRARAREDARWQNLVKQGEELLARVASARLGGAK